MMKVVCVMKFVASAIKKVASIHVRKLRIQKNIVTGFCFCSVYNKLDLFSFTGMPFYQAVNILKRQDRVIKGVQVWYSNQVRNNLTKTCPCDFSKVVKIENF